MKYLTGRSLYNTTLSFSQHVYIDICALVLITGGLEVKNLTIININKLYRLRVNKLILYYSTYSSNI